MMNYILFEIGLMVSGLVLLGPRAIQENLEPWLSLWWDWAELHKDNDFEEVWYDWDCKNHHPAGWYDEEFETWLEEQEIDTCNKEAYMGLCELEKYLVRHKLVKRQLFWNHWVYQINKDKLY